MNLELDPKKGEIVVHRKSYAEFKHRVLILLCGTSPAVVSETLFALATTDSGMRFLPTEIKVITTTEGRELLTEALLSQCVNSSKQNRVVSRLYRMAEDIGVSPFPLGVDDIIVPALEDGSEIPDAHSAEQLSAMGDLILDTLRSYTADDNTAVFFSLSGGRKSMGHIAGQSMTATARHWDKLIHVIVKPSWLERPDVDFYYPEINGQAIYHPDPESLPEAAKILNAQVDYSKIELELSQEPFLRLGPELLKVAKEYYDASFADLVTLLSDRPDSLTLTIDRKRGMAWIEDTLIDFSAKANKHLSMAYLITLARNKELSQPPTDSQMLEILQEWEDLEVAAENGDPTPHGRNERCKKFFLPLPESEANTKMTNYSQPTVVNFFWVSTEGTICHKLNIDRRRESMKASISHVRSAVKAALPGTARPSDYSLGDGRRDKRNKNDKTLMVKPAALKVAWAGSAE